MKVLIYLKETLKADSKELIELKKNPEEWERLKEDARKDAEASGITLED